MRLYALVTVLAILLLNTGCASRIVMRLAPGTPLHGVPIPSPPPEEVTERLTYLERTITQESVYATRYRWSWVGIFSGLAAYNFIRVGTGPDGARDAGIVGGIGSVGGLLSQLIFPLRAQYAPRELSRFRAHDDSTRIEHLREAERLLRLSAENEDFIHSWLSQLGRGCITIGLSLTLYLGFNRVNELGLNIGAGLIVGQMTVHTAPDSAIHAWESYVRRYPDAGMPMRRWGSLSSLMVVPQPNGAGIAMRF